MIRPVGFEPDRRTETDPRRFCTYRPAFIQELATDATGRTAAFVSIENAAGLHRLYRFTIGEAGPDGTFDIEWESGGRRLAVTRDGGVLLSATYHGQSVAAYNLRTGEALWRNQQLGPVQRLAIQETTSTVYASCDDGRCLVVNLGTGRVIRTIPGVDSAETSRLSGHAFLANRRSIRLVDDGHELFEWPARSFGLLTACLTPDVAVVAEAAQPLRAYSLSSGRAVWSTESAGLVHFLDVGYSTGRARLYAIGYQQNPGGRESQPVLVGVDPTSGELRRLTPPISDRGTFVLDATALLDPRCCLASLPE